jgi:hypothetical protein
LNRTAVSSPATRDRCAYVTIAGALVYAGMGASLGRWRAETPEPVARRDEPDDLREEVRTLVVADNERRQRRGQEPLEVEPEVERRLRELRDNCTPG